MELTNMKEQWNWKTIVLMALNGSGVKESDALMQIRVIEPMMEEFISSLLEQQKKDLIEQILKDAPEDYKLDTDDCADYNYVYGLKEGVNQCNSQWRELLNKLK